MGGMGAAPVMPMADPTGAAPEGAPPPPAFKIIHSPLDTFGKILADLDFKTFLQNNFGTDPRDLAHEIWEMYGGASDELGEGKKGRRQDTPLSGDPMQLQSAQDDEYNRTRKQRWERLPVGVSIDEITSPDALENAIKGGLHSLVQQNAKPAAAKAQAWLKLADRADKNKNYSCADKLLELIKDVYPLR